MHQLSDDHPFVLGRLAIPHSIGAFGYSDAEVLLHVICDALLGAANQRDIGFQFPDTEPNLKVIDSKILLKRTMALLSGKGYAVSNIDSTICLQKPKINPFIPKMKRVIAENLEVDQDAISIKATYY